jgi:hypothetical protein
MSRHRRKVPMGERIFNLAFLLALAFIGAAFAYVLRLVYLVAFHVPPPH